MNKDVCIIATRGSALALWQARAVGQRLAAVHRGLRVIVREVRTEGDRSQAGGTPLAMHEGRGVFTREVDNELLTQQADIAVHSLKDQTTTLPAGIRLGMTLERGVAEDALIARADIALLDLPKDAVLGTGSPRRRAQLLRIRPDLRFTEVRGNIDTRLRKLEEGQVDALVLARAGLERLGYANRITQTFAAEAVMPAPCQGIVGVTCREADEDTQALLLAADHPSTHAQALAERSLLRRLGGGCHAPIGALARTHKGVLYLRAVVLSPDGRKAAEAMGKGPIPEAEDIGVRVAQDLEARGAVALLRESSV
jgi:hydroxymethylbilane synthase